MADRTITYQGMGYVVTVAHPAADELPWNTEQDEFASLVQNMRDEGFDPDRPATKQRKTGLLIDGRRRELAARVAGIVPVYREVDWDDTQIIRWVQRDLSRRNVTPSQRAAVAVGLEGLLRRGSNQHRLENKGNEEGQNYPSSRSAAEIAAEIGVGEKTVDAAAKVKKKAPELLDAVKEGRLAANVAAKVADLPKRERKKVAEADDPKVAAKQALAPEPEQEPDEFDADGPAEDDEEEVPAEPDPLDARQSVGEFATAASAPEPPRKKPAKWMRPGNRPDPNHPHAKILAALSNVSRLITIAVASEGGERLKEYLTAVQVAKPPVPRLLAFRDAVFNGKKYGTVFVGLKGLRRVVKLAGMRGKAKDGAKLLTEYAAEDLPPDSQRAA